MTSSMTCRSHWNRFDYKSYCERESSTESDAVPKPGFVVTFPSAEHGSRALRGKKMRETCIVRWDWSNELNKWLQLAHPNLNVSEDRVPNRRSL
jgi:hypothetical protein